VTMLMLPALVGLLVLEGACLAAIHRRGETQVRGVLACRSADLRGLIPAAYQAAMSLLPLWLLGLVHCALCVKIQVPLPVHTPACARMCAVFTHARAAAGIGEWGRLRQRQPGPLLLGERVISGHAVQPLPLGHSLRASDGCLGIDAPGRGG